MRYKAIILYSFLMIVISYGCANSDDPMKIVKNYNDTVILAYRTGDTSKLSRVAGEREERIITVLIKTKESAGLRLESTLQKIEIKDAKRTGPDVMIIETQERWRYFDRPLQPGKSPGDVINSTMKVQYECGRVKGIWKVMRVMVLEQKFLDKE